MIKKNLLLYFLIFLFYTSCSSSDKKILLTGKISGAAGKWVYLQEMTVSKLVTVDSAQINNKEKFELEANLETFAFYSLRIEPSKRIVLALQPGDEVTIKGNYNNIENDYELDGSDDSELIRQINHQQLIALGEIQAIGTQYQDSIESPNLPKIKLKLDSIYVKIIHDHADYLKMIIHNNPSSFASLMALYQDLGAGNYIFNPDEDYYYFNLVDSSLQIKAPRSEPVRSLHAFVLDIQQKKDQVETRKKLLAVGVEAPEISLPNPKGDTINLSSLRGKYVLLDFWASWCNPCREENPNLVKNYNLFKEKGFTIYQVSLDRSRESWEKAIESDKLNWVQVSDLNYWNSVVVPLYHIQGIPTNLLLNPEGLIIAKDLRGEELGKKLQSIFK